MLRFDLSVLATGVSNYDMFLFINFGHVEWKFTKLTNKLRAQIWTRNTTIIKLIRSVQWLLLHMASTCKQWRKHWRQRWVCKNWVRQKIKATNLWFDDGRKVIRSRFDFDDESTVDVFSVTEPTNFSLCCNLTNYHLVSKKLYSFMGTFGLGIAIPGSRIPGSRTVF